MANRIATMSGGPIPQQQDGLVGKSIKNELEMVGGRFRGEAFTAGHRLLTCPKIEGAIEAHLLTTRINIGNRGLSTWRPHLHDGRL